MKYWLFHFLQNKLQWENWCLNRSKNLMITIQKGIEFHKAGKVEEADQYCLVRVKHPDANLIWGF